MEDDRRHFVSARYRVWIENPYEGVELEPTAPYSLVAHQGHREETPKGSNHKKKLRHAHAQATKKIH